MQCRQSCVQRCKVIALFTVCIVLAVAVSGNSQSQDIRIGPANQHPGNSTTYAASARLKLASRKTTYRFGELMSLDIAILNTSQSSLFLFSDFEPKFRVWDEKGKEVHVTPYGVSERVVDASSFTLTEANDFIVNSSLILIGCDKGTFASPSQNLETFNHNRFVNRGVGCLDTNVRGTYSITAELTNRSVVLSPDTDAKTPVGTIKSDTLILQVTE